MLGGTACCWGGGNGGGAVVVLMRLFSPAGYVLLVMYPPGVENAKGGTHEAASQPQCVALVM